MIAQAESVIDADAHVDDKNLHTSPATLEALDVIHERLESPASKLLRAAEPWSSYFVLPIFALANAGVRWSPGVLTGNGALVTAIVLGLVVGKPIGIVSGAWLASAMGFTKKPDVYSWRQLLGAGALGGIGFTMSLFIAAQAFENEAGVNASRIAIFIASITASALGFAILFPRRREPAS